MTTQVEICNMALGLLGAENITSINDNTRIAKVCKTFYSTTLLHILRSHNWNFAIKRASLTSTTPPVIVPVYEYSHSIAKPSDCLRIVEFYDYTQSFKEENGRILLNQQTVKCKYVRNDVAEADFDPSFIVCLASKLADVMCYQITQSATLVQSVQVRHKMDLAEARRNNAISNTPDAFQQSTWLATRL